MKSNWATWPVAKRPNTFPALTDEEREEILQNTPVTKCPPARIAVTFRQQLGRD